MHEGFKLEEFLALKFNVFSSFVLCETSFIDVKFSHELSRIPSGQVDVIIEKKRVHYFSSSLTIYKIPPLKLLTIAATSVSVGIQGIKVLQIASLVTLRAHEINAQYLVNLCFAL